MIPSPLTIPRLRTLGAAACGCRLCASLGRVSLQPANDAPSYHVEPLKLPPSAESRAALQRRSAVALVAGVAGHLEESPLHAPNVSQERASCLSPKRRGNFPPERLELRSCRT
jgi:hypothetical protein